MMGSGRGEGFSGHIGARGGPQREKEKGNVIREIGPQGVRGTRND